MRKYIKRALKFIIFIVIFFCASKYNNKINAKECEHDYSYIDKVESTCTTEGVYAHYICNKCGAIFDENKNETTLDALIIAKKDHNYSNLVRLIPPSCQVYGVKAHYYCFDCNKLFDENKIETTEEALRIEKTDHIYSNLILETPATCKSEGEHSHYICEICDKLFDENYVEVNAKDLIIPKCDHDYGNLIEEVPAVIDFAGVKSHYRCSVCNQYFDENKKEVSYNMLIIPPLKQLFFKDNIYLQTNDPIPNTYSLSVSDLNENSNLDFKKIHDDLHLNKKEEIKYVYDIKFMTKNNDGIYEEIPLSSIEEGLKVKIKFILPKDISLKDIKKVVHVSNQNNEIINFVTSEKDNSIFVEADHLSEFVIVCEYVNLDQCVLHIILIAMLLVFLTLFIILKTVFKYKKNNYIIRLLTIVFGVSTLIVTIQGLIKFCKYCLIMGIINLIFAFVVVIIDIYISKKFTDKYEDKLNVKMKKRIAREQMENRQ